MQLSDLLQVLCKICFEVHKYLPIKLCHSLLITETSQGAAERVSYMFCFSESSIQSPWLRLMERRCWCLRMRKAESMIRFLNSGEPRLNSLLGQGLKRSIPIFTEGTKQLSAFQGYTRQRQRISCYQVGSHKHHLLTESNRTFPIWSSALSKRSDHHILNQDKLAAHKWLTFHMQTVLYLTGL